MASDGAALPPDQLLDPGPDALRALRVDPRVDVVIPGMDRGIDPGDPGLSVNDPQDRPSGIPGAEGSRLGLPRDARGKKADEPARTLELAIPTFLRLSGEKRLKQWAAVRKWRGPTFAAVHPMLSRTMNG